MDNANGGKPYISDDYEANLEEAKQLMADAGYPDGEGFPVVEMIALIGAPEATVSRIISSLICLVFP